MGIARGASRWVSGAARRLALNPGARAGLQPLVALTATASTVHLHLAEVAASANWRRRPSTLPGRACQGEFHQVLKASTSRYQRRLYARFHQVDVACSEICADTGNREEFFGAIRSTGLFRAAVDSLSKGCRGKLPTTLFANFRSLAFKRGISGVTASDSRVLNIEPTYLVRWSQEMRNGRCAARLTTDSPRRR
jgi:hypothetical protein